MPDSVTYGSYSFPDPLPAIAESDNLIKVAGKYDHKSISVQAIGFITGETLSGLNTGKMAMVSGFLDEYQDLTVTVGSDERVFSKCLVNSINFAEGDLTTILPYTVDFLTYEDETFSDYFKVENPVNTWSYSEQEGKIVQATHTVSAKGLKVDASDPFDNARDFVTGKLDGGFQFVGLFNSGSNGFLTSRTEDVDRKTDTYSVTEVYSYSASDNPITDSGIVSLSTNINYSKDGGLSVNVQGSLQGSIDAITGNDLLTTGHFSPDRATQVAINSIKNSASDYENEVYSFVSNGPSAFNYTLDSGANRLDFDFQFENADNFDLVTGYNVIHMYDVNVQCSKDSPVSNVSVQGSLKYHGIDSSIYSVANASIENQRFLAVSGAFDAVTGRDGIYSLAKDGLDDFVSVATGYEFSSSYLRKEPVSFSINKNPNTNEISYNYTYNNSIDYSNNQLKDFKAVITDKVPIVLNKVQQTLVGFKANVVANRTLGEYSIDASANNGESDLSTLVNIASGLCSGKHKISDSHTINLNNITYNLAKYY